MILRNNWIKIVTALGYKDAENRTNEELVALINEHDFINTERNKLDLAHAMNEFENCLTIQGLNQIIEKYSHLKNNQAFKYAVTICENNLTSLKI